MLLAYFLGRLDILAINEMEFGYPLYKREAEIQELTERSNEVYSLQYRGQERSLKVIEVSIALPVYRIENGRTINLQKEYIAKNNKSKDYFTADPYSIETQKAQHELLKKLIEKEKLLDAFKKDKEVQHDPLICDNCGVIVNGNRRLCAWRELYKFDKQAYKHFQTVKLAVLPDHDKNGIADLEIALQIKEDLKLDYTWHAIASIIKREYDTGLDFKELADKFRRTPQEIRDYIESYNYAEQHLKAINATDQWSLMDDSYFALKEIVNRRKSFDNNINHKILFEKIAEIMLMTPAQGERLFRTITDVAKFIEPIQNKLEKVLDVTPKDEPDEADELLGGTENTTVPAIVNALNQTKSDIVIDTIKEEIKTQKEIVKDKNSQTYIISQVDKTITILDNAIANLNDQMEKEGIIEKLNRIEEKCEILRNWAK